jgi:hypothetical protein
VRLPTIFCEGKRTEAQSLGTNTKKQYDFAFSERLHWLFLYTRHKLGFLHTVRAAIRGPSMIIAAVLHERAARGRFCITLQRLINDMAKKVIFTLACAAGIALAAVQYMEMLGLVSQRCVIARTGNAAGGCPGE